MADMFDKVRERLFGSLDGKEPAKVESAEDQTEDERKLVSYIKSKVEDCRNSGARIASEGIWMTNTAYLLGFDSVFYDTTTKQFKPVGVSRTSIRRGRAHVNKILPTIQNRLARLAKNLPKYDIRPESTSTDDKDAARLGIEIINDIWDKQKINSKRLDMLMWMQQCGYALFKVVWDPTLGKPIINPETKEIDGFAGDIRVDTVSPFEFFPDPLAQTLDECQWVVQAKVRKLEYFRSMYPEDEGGRGNLVKEEGAWLLSSQYEMRINSLNNQGPVSSGTEAQMKNAAIELAYYEKRSKKYPKGRLIISANGILLHDGPLPIGEIPFAKFDDVKVAGKFASESIITHLRPIQDQYNRTVSRRAQWTDRLLAGKYMAPKGHGMAPESLNDQSGEVLEYNLVNGRGPEPVQVPMIPQWAYTEEDRLGNMFNEISGIGELSKGNLPQAGIPAIGMQFLQEQDETRIGVITDGNEYGYAYMGQLILKYASAFYESDRVLKIAGKGLNYAVKHFIGADLKNNFDVVVIKGSTLPNSKVLKRQEILNAYQQGILGPIGDPAVIQKLLESLEFGNIDEMWQDFAIDMQQIQEHVDMIEREEQPPVSEFDNHPLFIQELNRIRKSDKYKVMSPQSQSLLLGCMEANLQEIVKINNPGLQQQTQMADEMVDVGEQHEAEESSNMPPATAQLAQENQNIGDQLQAEQAAQNF